MSAFPTGFYEVDINFMSQVDDQALQNLCRSNKYFQNICNDDYLWSLKLDQAGFSGFKYLKGQGSFRDLYIQIKNNGVYVVIVGDITYLFNNINDAYNAFISQVASVSGVDKDTFPPIERAFEITDLYRSGLHFPDNYGAELYLLLSGKEAPMGEGLLLGINSVNSYNVGEVVGNVKVTITPNLSRLPVLGKSSDTYIFYIGYDPDLVGTNMLFDNNSKIGLEKIVPGKSYNQLFDRITFWVNTDGLLEDEFFVLRVGEKTYRTFTSHYMNDLFIFISPELPVLLIYKHGDGNYYLFVFPIEFYDRLDIHKTQYSSGKISIEARSGNIIAMFPTVLQTPTWKTVDKLIDYPVDNSILSKLQQGL